MVFVVLGGGLAADRQYFVCDERALPDVRGGDRAGEDSAGGVGDERPAAGGGGVAVPDPADGGAESPVGGVDGGVGRGMRGVDQGILQETPAGKQERRGVGLKSGLFSGVIR